MSDEPRSPFGEPLIRCEHLGDGAYVGFDGYQLWLWADRDGMRHWVALDQRAANALAAYLARVFAKPPTLEERRAITGEGQP